LESDPSDEEEDAQTADERKTVEGIVPRKTTKRWATFAAQP